MTPDALGFALAPQHLVVLPVLLPLATAAVMLLAGTRRRGAQALLNLASTSVNLVVALLLLAQVAAVAQAGTAAGAADPAQAGAAGALAVYLPGNWQVPLGIALVADRLSALMLVLAGGVALASLLFAIARWHLAGVYFHVLFQLQLMGLNGAFLTGDLFNLFVFFEVLLAASYGLLLHGGGRQRVRAGLHYVAVNLLASLLFLIGVAVLYGVAGTLNMADLALKLREVPAGDRGLLHAGAAILAVAFLAKAALWPLNFWLPPAYAAASTPVAGLFVILTKVGVYALLRLWTLCFAPGAGESALFGSAALVWGGLVTLAFGSVAMLASQHLARLAGYSVITSSGTLIAALGFNEPALSGGALYYMASSTLAGCALFLLVELLERARRMEVDTPRLDDPRRVLPTFTDAEQRPPVGVNLDDEEQVLIGRAIPAALAFLGVGFTLCALVIAGLPPLSGFVGKVAMLSTLLYVQGWAAWTLFALLILSGLAAATALLRVGMRCFWTLQGEPARLRVVETLPVGLLLAACALLVVRGEDALRYTRATAEALHRPGPYMDAVLRAQPVPPPSPAAAGETAP
ncbi:monovalent cation/H+ antiporter subunit D [Azohydromonas lata]|uniref:Monovalent cation/H+ antiporter subunit D n=1 Tax=Azohydromonas lata TaxID=45677 RepID=A0ABU5IEY7_9BURK|nr:monovalent cation/H+ antiporter subunit D [Azohydromonas lata]MDZ5457389.1 monovalent cation/H+ antiporter subunit D [Azohydromonas lata]